MPDVVATERVFPQPDVTYVTAARPGCRTLVNQIEQTAMGGADPAAALQTILDLVRAWKDAAA